MFLIVLLIILVLILLIFVVPYGVDAAYGEKELKLSIKAGPLRFRLLPKKPDSEKSPRQLEREERKRQKKEARKAEREAQKAAKKEAEKAAKAEAAASGTPPAPKKKPDIQFLLALVKMGIRAVKRVFKSFSVDYLQLYYVVATRDPYDTAIQYSRLCTAMDALPLLAGSVIHVRRSDVKLGMDFEGTKPQIQARLVISLQLYKIVFVAVAFAVEFISWKRKNRKKTKGTSERTGEYGTEQDQRTHGCHDDQDQAAG